MPDTELSEESQPREHRAGAWVLLIVGVAAFGLGIYQWRGSVLTAFDRGPSTFKTDDQKEQERLDELKTKDTDSDGINDFDESYVFNTSPYLDDSDSDGISDKEELETGTNPNCPEGKDCGVLGEEEVTDNGLLDAPEVLTTDDEEELINSMLNPTADQIRTLLLDSGVTPEELDQLDDETLIFLYKESFAEAQQQDSTQ